MEPPELREALRDGGAAAMRGRLDGRQLAKERLEVLVPDAEGVLETMAELVGRGVDVRNVAEPDVAALRWAWPRRLAARYHPGLSARPSRDSREGTTGRRAAGWPLSSWAVIGSKRFYFACDTGYAPHFEMIGRILGLLDLAALPIGSYSPRFIAKPIHMSPEDALLALRDLRAAKFIGIHWGTFELAHEPYDEPPRRIADEVARLGLDPRSILLPRPGEVLGW